MPNENNKQRGFFHVDKIEPSDVRTCICLYLKEGVMVDVFGAFCEENGQLFFYLDPQTFGFSEDYPIKGVADKQLEKLKNLGMNIENDYDYEILRYDVINSIINDFDCKYKHPLGEVTIDFENTKDMEDNWTRLGWWNTPAGSSLVEHDSSNSVEQPHDNAQHVSFNEFSDSFSSHSSASSQKTVSISVKSHPQTGVETTKQP